MPNSLGGLHCSTVMTPTFFGGEIMNTEMERRCAHAEAGRQEHELAREAAERARNTAEASRVEAENSRRAAAHEVAETLTTLTTIVARMEAVEAMRRLATG